MFITRVSTAMKVNSASVLNSYHSYSDPGFCDPCKGYSWSLVWTVSLNVTVTCQYCIIWMLQVPTELCMQWHLRIFRRLYVKNHSSEPTILNVTHARNKCFAMPCQCIKYFNYIRSDLALRRIMSDAENVYVYIPSSFSSHSEDGNLKYNKVKYFW